MKSLVVQVQTIMADPALARNLRGQLAAALKLLDTSTHQWLACDFAEHSLWLIDRVTKSDPTPRHVLSTIREYISGNVTWEKIASAHHELFTFGYSIGDDTGFEVRVAYEAWRAIAGAMRVCCHEALKQARIGSWSRNWRPNPMDVAIQVSYTVGLNAAGPAWKAEDAEIRVNARRNGHQASDEETQWQLGHLLDYITQRTASND